MKVLKGIMVGTITLMLTACDGSSGSMKVPIKTDTPLNKYQGIWLAPAYGKGLEIKETQLTLFDYTSDFCFVDEVLNGLEEADLIEALSLQNNTEIEQMLGYGAREIYAPGILFSKELSMPIACEQGFMPQVGNEEYSVNYERDLTYFYQTFKELSISIELQQLDWENMYISAQQLLAADPTEFTLIRALVDMIEPLKDGHTGIGEELEVSFPNKPYFTTIFFNEFLELNGIDQIENSTQEQAAIAYIVEQNDLMNDIIVDYAENESDITIGANENLMWFQVDGIGYLQIAGMQGFAGSDDDEQELSILEASLEQALNDLQYTKGLIIDVRRNNGGHDFISLAIASRFTDQQVFAYQKQARHGSARTPIREVHISPRGNFQYLNPVVLLTSASTLSAAEVFTMTMANLPHVNIMGERTQGEFSDVLEKTLPSGLKFGLSNEYYLTTHGEWLEGKGVPVDIEHPAFVRSERSALEDLALEAAFELLSNQ
ncbi:MULTISPECIES: S41 family peptidase [Thalassotalea]|uniref:S41 family peptidase n=1 Tax=Thalassotalea TaxID=1518149 RepID=UPI0009F9C83D|nr:MULTISPECIES: S41 family peptidase [Thalassotalea]